MASTPRRSVPLTGLSLSGLGSWLQHHAGPSLSPGCLCLDLAHGFNTTPVRPSNRAVFVWTWLMASTPRRSVPLTGLSLSGLGSWLQHHAGPSLSPGCLCLDLAHGFNTTPVRPSHRAVFVWTWLMASTPRRSVPLTGLSLSGLGSWLQHHAGPSL